MNARQLLVLSPYRLPTESTLYLGDEEIAAILNGYSALWHPAALRRAAALPRLVSPYDVETPAGDAVYVLPDNPPLMLADDWQERARASGAILVSSSSDREQTIAHLLDALREQHGDDPAFDRLAQLPAEQVRPFLGIGFGCLVLEAIFEAMSHENAIPPDDLRGDLAAAVEALLADDPAAQRGHLQAAAERLLAAREVIYPASLYLVDLFLLDPADRNVSWPAAVAAGLPVNLISCAALLERLAAEQPQRLTELRQRLDGGLAEVLGGPYVEREDPLLPIESQLWNLVQGQAAYRRLIGQDVRVFARRRFGFHAQMPLLLQSVGISHALFISFDESLTPSHHAVVVSWPSHDGKQVTAFTRPPQPADSPQTFFHLAHYLHQTIMQDQAATFVLLHRDQPAAPWYDDWVELTRLAPVLGRWVTLTGYFNEVFSGDYTAASSPDEFSADYLSDRTTTTEAPISGLARWTRGRRRLDAAWTFAAILRSLGGPLGDLDGRPYLDLLADEERRFETAGETTAERLLDLQQHAATALAGRLVARGPADAPGYLLLNPCGFPRRVAVELPGLAAPLPAGGPVKACQLDGAVDRAVVEVPPLGFTWLPRNPPSSTPMTARMRLADERAVRNEFFEAEIDPHTGGLRGIRDQRQRIGRVGQQLVFNPGSSMRADSVSVVSAGPALGEVHTSGVLLDDSQELIARFRQRFRAWLGRPVLELTIEIDPVKSPEGYPWYAYYAARFAWRDEGTILLRGSSGLRATTTQNRPDTPDYLELRIGRTNTVLFPGGLPFHQRTGGRMLDVLLLCEHEAARTFELGIGLEREQPMQTAHGFVSPVAVVPTTQGPPHVGATGWLYLLDASNVLLTSLRPAPDHADAVVATLLETGGVGTAVQLRTVRNPVRAAVLDLAGNTLYEPTVHDDAVELDVAANDLLQLRVEFS